LATTLDARRFSEKIVLPHGKAAIVRAIRPDDRDRLAAAFLALEPESVYLRYFTYKKELTEADLDRLCNPDFRERVVLVVTVGDGAKEVMIGAGGYVARDAPDATPDAKRVAEVAFVVGEAFRGQGIAGKLLAVLVPIARNDGIVQFEAEVLTRNAPMLEVFARSGLPMEQKHEDDSVVRLTLSLLAANPAGVSR